MGLPVYKSCCFCMPLRTGTLVLAYLQLIVLVFGIVGSLIMILGGAVLTSGASDLKNKDLRLDQELRDSGITNEGEVEMAGIMVLVMGIIYLIVCNVYLVFVIFLLIGVYKGKPGHIKVYLVFSVVMWVVGFIWTVFILVSAPTFHFSVFFIFYAPHTYYLLVIRSYMVQLRDNPEGDRAGIVYKS